MTSNIDLDLPSILAFTISLARDAGTVILEGSTAIQSADASKDVNLKKNSVDLVTEYDVRVEELVRERLSKQYPGFEFIGEESYAAGVPLALTDAPTFCVDPIDGTTNFIHGFPWVCISIGLIYKKRPVLGVIYNPFLDWLYTGVKGGGSYLVRSGQPAQKLPLSSSPKPLVSLGEAQIAVEWGNDRSKPTLSARSASFHRLAGDPSTGVEGGKMVHSIRSLGSSALNFAMVAQGGLDMYWEIGCYAWDVSAGIIIAQEAGGRVTGSHEYFAKTPTTDTEAGEEVLFGRKYLVIRALGDSQEETGVDAQLRIMKEYYDSVTDYAAN